jgi:hypothetical protein
MGFAEWPTQTTYSTSGIVFDGDGKIVAGSEEFLLNPDLIGKQLTKCLERII